MTKYNDICQEFLHISFDYSNIEYHLDMNIILLDMILDKLDTDTNITLSEVVFLLKLFRKSISTDVILPYHKILSYHGSILKRYRDIIN